MNNSEIPGKRIKLHIDGSFYVIGDELPSYEIRVKIIKKHIKIKKKGKHRIQIYFDVERV